MKIGEAKAAESYRDGSNLWKANEAEDKLKSMRLALNDGKGGTRSGYLRLTKSGDMNAGGFFTSGKTDKATDEIKKMIATAYGRTVPRAVMDDVTKAIDTYTKKTGHSFGTRSFVKLIDFLDHKKANVTAPEPQSLNTDISKARLNLQLSPGTEDSLRIQPLLDDLRAGEKSDEEIREIVGKLGEGGFVSETGLETFKALACEMNKVKGGEGRNAFVHFARLMFPRVSSVGGISEVSSGQPKKFVMGDADGSMGRMVLHTLASGVATLPNEQIADLALVLQREHEQEALEIQKSIQREVGNGEGQKAPYEEFQQSAEVDTALKGITRELKLVPQSKDKAPRCIFLGDIISDRLTVNQRTLSDLIRKLSGYAGDGNKQDTGVVFIAGNHDTSHTDSFQFAGGLREMEDRLLEHKEVNKLLEDCFKAAHLEDGVLFTHHGVRQKENGPGRFQIAFGPVDFSVTDFPQGKTIEAQGPEDLEEKMNLRFFELLRANQLQISTDFRPDDDVLSEAGFRQVHGHTGESNEAHAGVTNLNARETGKPGLCPTSMVFQ